MTRTLDIGHTKRTAVGPTSPTKTQATNLESLTSQFLTLNHTLDHSRQEADVKAASILSGVKGMRQDWGEAEDDDSMAAALAQAAVAQVDGAVDGGRSTSHERTEAHREGGDANTSSSAGSGNHESPVDLNEEKESLLNLMASKGLPMRTRLGTKPIR